MNLEFKQQVLNIKLPRYNELPNIGLYIDQVITYLEKTIGILYTQDECITASMVANYVNQGLMTPTNKKKYTNDHIAFLILIFIFKQIYSINEIKAIIKVHEDIGFPVEKSYNYLASELENVLKSTFSKQGVPQDSIKIHSELRFFIRSSVIAYANKFYTLQLLKKYSKK
ncbi:MAG: DUF1836 domain-containing protein [Clostridia bacterium]